MSGASTSDVSKFPQVTPPVDERIVAPGSRFEIFDGKLDYMSPADEPHGTRHSKIAALLEAFARDEYDVAVDMLTRTSVASDMAPDVSVFPRARDPESGGRRLEELAFEVASTERLSKAAVKAAALVARGVRRVFAVDVERGRAVEWSSMTESWQILERRGTIEDSALVLPLPIDALVEAFKADDAVASALLAKQNPVLESALDSRRAEGKAEGRAEGKAEAIVDILRTRGIEVPLDIERRICATRAPAKLDALLVRAITCTRIDELSID